MFTVSTCTLKTSTFHGERCRDFNVYEHTQTYMCAHAQVELWVKRKEGRQKHKQNQSLLRFRRLLAERLKAQEPTLPCRTVPGAILHTDPRSFTSHTKHPVSANQAEVLVSAANECVWCQRAVLWPGSPSVWRIHEDESQMRLKVLGAPISPLVLWEKQKRKKKEMKPETGWFETLKTWSHHWNVSLSFFFPLSIALMHESHGRIV